MKRGRKSRKAHVNVPPELQKTLLVTGVLSLLAVILAIFVQLTAQSSVEGCSYLDPITIDILALLASVFLIIEGLYRIYEHPHAEVKSQMTRMIRVAAGCAILALHILQFSHK